MALQNDLLLRVLRGETVERPPVWLMRQAGRILPQYRAVRASLSGFIELVTTPERVAEVTIQPVDELGVDAAIIFSDILVIPEAMGLPYEMVEKKGPFFPKTVQTPEDLNHLLEGEVVAEALEYVYEGIRLTKQGLADRVPLIGFAGSPFTLLCYMIEGQGSKTFSKAKGFMYRYPEASHALLNKITNSIIAYLHKKIEAGVNVVQLFDSWAGVLDSDMYRNFCVPYIKKINDAIISKIPVIVFSKGAWFSIEDLHEIGSTALGVDWNTPISFIRKMVGPSKVLQGNLDPCQLYDSPDSIKQATINMIKQFGRNHIVNLGHGVYPDTPLDNVKVFVDTVKAFRY